MLFSFFLLLSIFPISAAERADFCPSVIPVHGPPIVMWPIFDIGAPVGPIVDPIIRPANFCDQALSFPGQQARRVKKIREAFSTPPLETLAADAFPSVPPALTGFLLSEISWGPSLLDLYKQASRGDTAAQSQIYEKYQSKRGVFSKPEKLFRKLDRRAGQGEIFAAIMMAWMLRDGYGISKNRPKSL